MLFLIKILTVVWKLNVCDSFIYFCLQVTDQTAAPPGETDDLDDVDLVNCRILEELVASSDEC